MSIEWISQLRKIVVDSLEKSWLPLPIKEDLCEGWKKDLQAGPSSTILYTSCMYHIAPVIEKAVENLEKFGVAKGGVMARLASVGAKALGGFLLRPDEAEVRRADGIVRRIYELLKRAGVEFGLLDREIYSGALLYELGLVDDFARYARRAAEYFKKHGVRRIITVDPHTHYVLEKIYPKYVEGFDIEVVSYLDLIGPGGVSINGFTIHDSCLYARFLGRYERIRQLLAAGNPVEDPYITGKDTAGCCGGPIESLFPEVSRKVAEVRVRDLSKLSNKVVVQCPICYVNLKRAAQSGLEFYHVAEVLT
jgi:Fe-S oxidoreductase